MRCLLCVAVLLGVLFCAGCHAPAMVTDQEGGLDPEAMQTLALFLERVKFTGNVDINSDGLFEVGLKQAAYVKFPIDFSANGQAGPTEVHDIVQHQDE